MDPSPSKKAKVVDPESSAPETSAPETSAPETSAPEPSVAETSTSTVEDASASDAQPVAEEKVVSADSDAKAESADGGEGSSAPPSVDLEGIDASGLKKQIEFYFSDSNMPRDRFLREEASKNPEGFVPISVIARFVRVASFKATIPQIAQVLRTSTSLAVSEDGKMVKRIAPLPLEDVTLERSLFVEGGLPTDATLDSLIALFSKYGQVISVRMRRGKDKKFTGSVFVEYENEEVSKSAIEAMKDIGANQIIPKKEWLAKQRAERKRKKASGDDDGRKKKRKSNDEGDGEDEDASEKPVVPAHGLIISIGNVGKGANRFDVKGLFEEYGKVKFVEYKEDESDGFIRMGDAEEAQAAVKAITDSEKQIGGQVITCSILQGEDERAYWAKIPVGKPKSKKKGKKRRRDH